jgi:hypothetical protein
MYVSNLYCSGHVVLVLMSVFIMYNQTFPSILYNCYESRSFTYTDVLELSTSGISTSILASYSVPMALN